VEVGGEEDVRVYASKFIMAKKLTSSVSVSDPLSFHFFTSYKNGDQIMKKKILCGVRLFRSVNTCVLGSFLITRKGCCRNSSAPTDFLLHLFWPRNKEFRSMFLLWAHIGVRHVST
jgi:hypothetical protein